MIWDGYAKIKNNRVLSAQPINFFNPDKSLNFSANDVSWKALTTGNFGGFDLIIENNNEGELEINTPLIQEKLNIKDIGYQDCIFENNGVLPRFLKVFRLPQTNKNTSLNIKRNIRLKNTDDNPIFIRLTQEDGTLAWTSPIYIYRN